MPLAPPPNSTTSDVDVVITTRNDGPALSELVNQLPAGGIRQLVIVDDGSTDIEALDMLGRLEEGGYRVVRQDRGGLSRARNEGTRLSRAPFLLYLDVDTVPLEGFLTGATTKLQDDSDIAAVLADGHWQGDGGRIVVAQPDTDSMVAALHSGSVAVWRRAAIEKDGRLGRTAADRAGSRPLPVPGRGGLVVCQASIDGVHQIRQRPGPGPLARYSDHPVRRHPYRREAP